MQTTAFRTRDGALRGLGRDPTSAVLLNAVASAAIALTRSPNLQKSLRQALEILGEATCVDRVNVFRYDHAEAAADVFAEWAKPGVPPCSATSPGPFRHADYLEVFEPTMRGEAYHSNLAEKLGANLKLNELNGVYSDLLVPIFVREEFWGLLNFDDCSRERTWGNGEIEMLRIASEVIAAALRREALEQEKTEAVAREREQAAKERVAELKRANLALGRATAGLVGEADAATFLCTLQAETTAFTGAKTSGIFIYDESTERLRMFALMTSGASVDLATDPRMEVWRNDVPLPITRRWIEQLRSRDFAAFDNHTAPEAHPWPISRKWHEMMGHRYIITVPLYVGQRMIGTFGQCFPDGYDVARFDFALTRVFANHAALALQLTQLADEARQAAIIREQEINTRRLLTEVERFNQALQRTTSLLTQGLSLREFLGHVLTECLEMMRADFAHILTYDPVNESLSFAVGARPGRIYLEALPEEPDIFRQPMPASSFPIFGFLRSEKRVALLSQNAKDAPPPEPIARWFAAEGIREVAGLLLAVGEEPVGFVGMAFRTDKPLPPEQIKFFQALAHQAALAVAISRLNERVRITAVLDERARLAGQIHDTLAQQFTGALLHLEALSTRAARGYRVTSEDLQTVRKIAAFGLAEARRSALNLRPLELDTGTLADALQHLAERSRVAGLLECDFSHTGAVGRMKAADEEALLNIAHEAVNNAIRHADASRIRIQLNHSPGLVELVIADDGRGFDHSQTHQQGRTFGLRSMEARAAGMGARFEVDSKPGHGTVVIVRVPMA
jgi:signal transduction histidine kinase